MFGDDIAVYLPEHIRPFAEQLRQFPRGYEKWIYAAAVTPNVYQGDVIGDVPFVAIDDDGDPVRAELPGMVVSNTCDIQPEQGEFVLVAPVIDLKTYQEGNELEAEELDNHVRALKENKISNLMFLPGGPNVSDCFVDFGRLCSISSARFHQGDAKRVVSLSQYGHYFLLMKLSYHFARPESADAVRQA